MKKLILGLLLTSASISFAQTEATSQATPKERPVIGLCLSGGGAKGFSHIGILKVIDSLGIPIDYITGTSMGSIIGGMYAIGYTPEQMELEITQADWADLLNPKPKRKYESFSTKDFLKRNLLTVGIEEGKVKLPSGLNNANKLYQRLHKITIGYHGDKDFIEFPRGFECVAANLNTGEEVFIKEGSLPDAMRASMSLPSMFMPHKYRNTTYVDGGTLNNFPTDELKKLGCDIIIGVDLQTTIDDTTEASITKVLEKTSMFTNFQTNKARQDLCDVLIRPDLTGYTTNDFDQGLGLISRGLAAGRAHANELAQLADRAKNRSPQNISPYNKLDSVVVSQVIINGLNRVSQSYVLGNINIEPNEKVAIDDLEEDISNLYGSSYFIYATYNLIADNATNSSYTAVFNLQESPYDLDIGIGLHYDPDYKTGILLNLYTRNLLVKGSRLNFDLVFSERPRFRLLYEVDRGHKPGFGLTSDAYFIQPTLYNQFAQSEGMYNFNSSTTALYTLLTNRNHRILKLGAEYNNTLMNFENVPLLRLIVDPDNTNPDLTKIRYNLINLFTELDFDNMDDFDHPKSGQKFYLGIRYHTEFEGYLEDVFSKNYLTSRLEYAGAFSPTSWLTFVPKIDAGVSLLDYSEIPYAFYVGGMGRNYFGYQISFPGYHYMQLAGLSNFSTGQLEIRTMPFKNNYLSVLGGYGYYTRETGKLEVETLNWDDLAPIAGFGFKYSIQTFVGPVEIVAHKDLINGYPWLFYFNFGYWF